MPSGKLKFAEPAGLSGLTATQGTRTDIGERDGTITSPPRTATGKGRRVKYRRDAILDGSSITASFQPV